MTEQNINVSNYKLLSGLSCTVILLDKECYPQIFLKECKYAIKRKDNESNYEMILMKEFVNTILIFMDLIIYTIFFVIHS